LSKENAKKVARFWPHLHHTGGFFIAKFRKKNFRELEAENARELDPKSPEGATHPRIGHRPINKGRPINNKNIWEYSGELQKKVRAYVKEQ
jgi:hypothetical protein